MQKVFSSKNIFTLIKAAEVLDKSLDTLIYGTTNQQAINGFVEVNGTVFRIKDRKDIEDLLEKI